MLTAPIGILGGTFDPIHYGHLRLGEELGETLRLDEVRLLPSGTPPHRAAAVASSEHRLAMTRLAVEGNPRFRVDDREVLAHGVETGIIKRLPDGRFVEVHQPLADGHLEYSGTAVPKKMNKIGAQTNHPPSMLYDIQRRCATEVDFLGGAVAREAERLGVAAPLHTALYQLIKGKEFSWTE